MKKQIVEHQTASLARKKNFDYKCNTFYLETGEKLFLRAYNHEGYIIEGQKEDYQELSNSDLSFDFPVFDEYTNRISCTAPTQEQLQEWLRKKHKIYLQPQYTGGPSKEAYFSFNYARLEWINEGFQPLTETCLPFEEALEVALIKILQLL